MFVVPVGSNFGLRAPHFLVTSTVDYPAGRPLAQPRLQLPSGRPSVLFAGTPPYPVVEVNALWLAACGMRRDEVVGKTMIIIQGPATEMEKVQRLMVQYACVAACYLCLRTCCVLRAACRYCAACYLPPDRSR